MKRKLLWFLGNSILGAVLYVFFLWLTFPSDVARDRVVYEADRAGIRMQVESVKPSWPWGVSLTMVDIFGSSKEKKVRPELGRKKPTVIPGMTRPTEEGGEGTPTADSEPSSPAPGAAADPAAEPPSDAPVARLSLDRLRITSLLETALARGKSIEDIHFDADLYGGSLEGSLDEDDEVRHLILKAAELDLARYPFVGENFDLKIGGRLGLDIDLNIHRSKIRESSGAVTLSLANLALFKGSRVMGFDLPIEGPFQISGGELEVKNGRVELGEMKLEHESLTVESQGSLMLNASFMRSRLNLKVALKLGGSLEPLGLALAKEAKSDDGYFHYVVSGTLDRLNIRPDRMSARRRGKNTPAAGMDSPDREPLSAAVSGSSSDSAPMRPPRPFGEAFPGGGPAGPGPFTPPELNDSERERLREERRKRAEERRQRREELRKRRLELNGGVDEPSDAPRLPMPERTLRSLGVDPDLIDQVEIPPPPLPGGEFQDEPPQFPAPDVNNEQEFHEPPLFDE